MDMGVGYAGLQKLCRYLDIGCLHHKTYAAHVKGVAQATNTVTTSTLDDAARVVRRVYRERDPSLPADGVIDLTVSYDGSWMTRGHRSLYGIGCVIDVVTGLVLDFAVLSRYCQCCTYASTRYGGVATAEFQQWKASHTDCQANYTGSAGGMEMAAAEELWRRSLAKYQFRYTTLLSDGDAKTHTHLCGLEVYGGDVGILKEECVNHVAKRLGTALRKLSTQSRKRGVTLGGRGFGKLTAATVVKLTGYYGKAIRSHAHDLQGMSDAVFATFDHAVSTDEKPQHSLCPQGADSWCFHQRALALGETPGSHRANVGTPLSAEVGAEVREVYERLGHRDLLRRCLRGATQNANECLHSKVWAKCPKTSFVGYQRAVIATSAAVAEFNGGIELSLRRMCAAMGVVSGERLVVSAVKADGRRLLQSQHQVTASTREARRAKKVAKARSQDTGTEYSAGAF